MASLHWREPVSQSYKKKKIDRPILQILTIFHRQGTIVNYQDPNDRGESLFIQASVMDVDFTAKSYKIHFLLEPNGTLAGDNGVLRWVNYAGPLFGGIR